jgi:hypothetical protein
MALTSRSAASRTRLLLTLFTSAAFLGAGEVSGASLTASGVDNSKGVATTRLERRGGNAAAFAAIADVSPGVTEYVDTSGQVRQGDRVRRRERLRVDPEQRESGAGQHGHDLRVGQVERVETLAHRGRESHRDVLGVRELRADDQQHQPRDLLDRERHRRGQSDLGRRAGRGPVPSPRVRVERYDTDRLHRWGARRIVAPDTHSGR